MHNAPSLASAFLVFNAALLLAGCAREVDDKGLTYAEDFGMKDVLLCTIARSSTTADVGSLITIQGLTEDKVRILFESGNTSPMQRIYDTEETVVLQLVATGTGSVDSIVIDKTTGKFSRAQAGSLAGVYASASVGTCR